MRQITLNTILQGTTVISVALFLLLEWWRPLRQRTVSKLVRASINFFWAVMGALVIRLALMPAVLAAAFYAQEHRLGLLNLVALPLLIKTILGLLLLDYTLYVWHWLNHRVSWFWRFHQVHHSDLEMDVTTALRFHSGELLLSLVYRVGQVFILGIDPALVLSFDLIVGLAAQFHHSNLRLPVVVELWLNRLLVSPRMHAIHHSVIAQEANSNFASIFPWWDWLHQTFKPFNGEEDLRIGLPALRKLEELLPWPLILMPFGKIEQLEADPGATGRPCANVARCTEKILPESASINRN